MAKTYIELVRERRVSALDELLDQFEAGQWSMPAGGTSGFYAGEEAETYTRNVAHMRSLYAEREAVQADGA